MTLAVPIADAGENWRTYNQRQIRKLLNKKRPLLNFAEYLQDDRVLVGAFSIPKKKRKNFTAVTEWHYHNGCNELALALIGILVYDKDPEIEPYLDPGSFEKGRNNNRFHKPRIQMSIKKELRPDAYFPISMRLLGIHKTENTIYAHVKVAGAVEGKLLYSYRTGEPL